MKVQERGPWSAGINEIDRRAFVQSDDFTNDARLYVNGDFGSEEKRIAYAEEMARRLNALNELAQYFTIGNSVPVERATILANDFWRITGLTPNVIAQGREAGLPAKRPLERRVGRQQAKA